MSTASDVRVERLLREVAPEVLGALARRFRDLAASEDAMQEALIAASVQWPRDGLPDEPRAWLFQVAARRIADHVRSETARRRREAFVVSLVPPEEQVALPADRDEAVERDDTLVLLFMCCHPALTRSSAVALTLRAVGGLTTGEIARAFMVPEATMAQRISRAKQTVKAAGASFDMPTGDVEEARLGAALHVLYLIFSEGYATSSGHELQRRDLANEAIRLTRKLRDTLPDHAEVAGLLALMLLTDARRLARTDAEGALVPLDRQDRSLWDREAIAEGVRIVSEVLPRGQIGEYQIQAAIAAVHDEAESAETTDWPQILALYGVLREMNDNPMVTLSHAIAVAMVRGPREGLACLVPLVADPRLRGSHRVDAVEAHLLERAGDLDAAVERYRRAADRTTSTPERNYLLLRAANLESAKAPAVGVVSAR